MEKTASPSEPPLSLLAGGFSELSLYLCVILGRIWWGNGEMLQKIWSWAKFLPYVVSGFLQPKKIRRFFDPERVYSTLYSFGASESSDIFLDGSNWNYLSPLIPTLCLSFSLQTWAVQIRNGQFGCANGTTRSALEKIFEDKGLFSLSSLHE